MTRSKILTIHNLDIEFGIADSCFYNARKDGHLSLDMYHPLHSASLSELVTLNKQLRPISLEYH